MDFARPPPALGDGSESQGGAGSRGPERPQIEASRDRILASRSFSGSPRLQALLNYLVGETLDGRADRLKEFTVAVDVFGRPDSFDPRTDSIVRVQASRLRAQLADYYAREGAADPVRIELPPGGYAVQFRPGHDAPTPTGSATAEPADPSPAERSASPAPSQPGAPAIAPSHRRRWLMVAVLAVATLVLGAAIMLAVSPSQGPATSAASPSQGPTVFVARYQLIGGGPDYATALRDGLQYDLIDSLSRFPELSVLGIDTVFGSSGDAARADPRGADFILAGSIQATGGQLRVTSQLVETRTNRVVWSEVHDGPLADGSDVLAVQARIAGSVAGQLGQPHGVIQERLKEELTGERAVSMEDYLCVLDAYEYSRAKTRERHAEVRACLEAVVQRSPLYSPAWAKLSWMYGDEERYHFNPRSAPLERALRAAEQAVAANSTSAMAHQYLAIARFHAGDTEGFRSSIATALALNPNNAEILADAGYMLSLLEGSEEARALAEKAIRLNPGHPPWYHQALAVYHLRKGDRATALAAAQEAAPDGAPVSAYLLAAALRLNDRDEEADAVLADLKRRYADALVDPSRRDEIARASHLPPAVASLIFRR